jgi:hypothetical protein
MIPSHHWRAARREPAGFLAFIPRITGGLTPLTPRRSPIG